MLYQGGMGGHAPGRPVFYFSPWECCPAERVMGAELGGTWRVAAHWQAPVSISVRSLQTKPILIRECADAAAHIPRRSSVRRGESHWLRLLTSLPTVTDADSIGGGVMQPFWMLVAFP